MRRLYLQIYLTVVGCLLLFALLLSAAWVLLPESEGQRRGMEGLAELAGDLLPPAERPRPELELALERLGHQLHSDLAVRAPDGLTLAGLRALEERPAHELSVGEQQRATMARTLIGGPEVLLLDEPTSALDPESSEFLLESIRRLRAERGMTVILSTHRHYEAAAIADEAVRLSGGAVEEYGEATDVLA